MQKQPKKSAEKITPIDPTEELRKLRAYLQGKSESMEKLNAEQEQTLDDVERKRLSAAEEAIQKRKALSMELAG